MSFLPKLDPTKCKVRCRQVVDKPTGRTFFEAYIYEGDLSSKKIRHWVCGVTREAALKKLAIQIFDDLVFEEENKADISGT